MTPAQSCPRLVSVGEALTDLIRQEDRYWMARSGGAPWNVARVLAAFGIPSAFAGSVGSDAFGNEIAAQTRQAGLDMRFLQQYDKPSLLAVVHETAPPKYHFIGVDSADLAFDPSLLPGEWADSVEWLHCGGISLVRPPLRERIMEMLTIAKAAGARLSFDPNFRNVMTPAYDDTLTAVARMADVIKVSDEDLRGLFRTGDMDRALAQLIALNPQAIILLTLGAGGAELHAAGTSFRQASPRTRIADTVGAGDASVGGLLYSLMSRPQGNGAMHLRYAVAAGTAACLQSGATPPTLASVNEVLAGMG